MSNKTHLSKKELNKIIESKLSKLYSYGVHGTAIKKYKERYYNAQSGKQFGKLTSLMNELKVINENINKKSDIEKAYGEWKEKQYITVVKETKENEFSVENVINTPDMVTTIYKADGTSTQTAGSYSRDMGNIRNLLKKYAGKNITIDYLINGDEIIHHEYEIPNENFNNWFNGGDTEHFYDWLGGSGKTIFWVNGYEGILKISFIVDVVKKVEPQFYLDGINHCVFHPIKLWAEEKMCEAKSEKTKLNYKTKINSINDFIEEYKNGVPDNENIINKICNKLQINISIETPFQDKIFDCKSVIKGFKNFQFINTRLNHVDCNEVVDISNFKKVSYNDLLEIKKELDDNNSYYQYEKHKNITSLSTLYDTYRTSGEFTELKNEFLVESGLNNCMVDDVDDKELSNFIRHGMHYNTLRDLKKGVGIIEHSDMKKAYANYRKCHMYEGFLGKITDFRKCDKIMGIGLYCIDNLDFSKCDEKFKYYEHNLIMYNNKCVYASVELKLLSSYGVIYDILYGCWGVSPIDFDLNDDIVNGFEITVSKSGKENKISYYAKLFGSFDQHNLTKKVWLKGNQEYFESMAYHSELKCKYANNGEGYFIKRKSHNYHLTHITAFITAYQRISLMEQLMAMESDKVVRVCTDGIYYEPHKFILKNVFVKKDGEKAFKIDESTAYLSGLRQYDNNMLSDNRDNYEISLYKGVGGSGKTHININDNGFIRKAYFVTSWKLANEKKKETGIYSNVNANLLTTDPEKINVIKKFNNVLIIDECSMISNENKNYIIDTYKGCKIIFCGDNGFQLDGIDTLTKKGGVYTVFNEERINFIQNFTYSHRCKCEKLRKLSDRLREFIENKCSFESVKEYIIGVFKQAKQTITKGVLKNRYFVDDMILCWRKEKMAEYSNMFRGEFKKEKYVVSDNKILNYNNGDIIISKDEFKFNCIDKDDGLYNGVLNGVNVQIKHAFTVHSVQGITCYNKLYIDINDMKDVKMIYTAISRAQYLNKIMLIV